MTKVAINGFGRIGRSILRALLCHKHNDLQIVAINDISNWEVLAYLLEHDSTHGHLGCNITHSNNMLHFSNDILPPIHTLCESAPDFGAFDIDILLESSGAHLDSSALQQHCKGAKRTMLCAVPKDNMPMYAMGVNHIDYKGEAIFSNASCTANALAPICKVIDKHFGIDALSFCITHSYTNEQSLLDSAYNNDKRRSRAAVQNIIPTSTGAKAALERLLPNLKDKIGGHNIRIPLANMLFLDMSFMLSKATSAKALNDCLIESSHNDMQGIIAIDDRYGVSSDFIGHSASVIVAPDLTYITNGNMARIMAWSDNEWGYASRVLDMVRFVATYNA